MEWADETIIRLRELWAEGHSTAEIGRRLGISKNAVVGKAHRLDLPARPSPIRREGDGSFTRVPHPPRPARVPASTLPPLASVAAPPPPPPTPAAASAPAQPPVVQKPDQPATTQRPAAVSPPKAPEPPRLAVTAARTDPTHPQPPRRRDGSGCLFPIGEPGTRSFRFCEGDLDPAGGPYCCDHHKMCSTKIRDRRVTAEAIAA